MYLLVLVNDCHVLFELSILTVCLETVRVFTIIGNYACMFCYWKLCVHFHLLETMRVFSD